MLDSILVNIDTDLGLVWRRVAVITLIGIFRINTGGSVFRMLTEHLAALQQLVLLVLVSQLLIGVFQLLVGIKQVIDGLDTLLLLSGDSASTREGGRKPCRRHSSSAVRRASSR